MGTTREKGGAVAERKDREILTILSRWRQKGREGELWSLSPVTTVQALHPSSAVMCHGTCVVALCATGMTAGISPGLLCYYCLMQNTHHQPRRFHLLDPATSFLLENSRFPQVPVNKHHRHPGQSQEIWDPGLILITRLRLEYRPSKVSVKTQVSFLPPLLEGSGCWWPSAA